jgi:hypothetical protein
MKSIERIATEIREHLECGYTHYFNVEDLKGNSVKIRVGNHSANRQNNSDSENTLSFVTERTEQKKSGYNRMINEWAILENGLTDTYEEIEYILENELGF